MTDTVSPSPPVGVTAAARPEPVVAPDTKQRLIYLDNLKIILTAGVIACHATLIYGPGSGWLGYHEGNPGITETLILGVPGMLGGLFWLGVFFLIAGLFVPKSLQKKGAWKFSRERIIHLGIPLAVYALIVMPLLKYAVVRALGQTTQSPWGWSFDHIVPLYAGPLWFVGALMIFSVAYAIYDRIWPGRPKGDAAITVHGMVFLALAITVLSFLFRLKWPIYSDQFLGLHLWQWPQYILLFWAGAWAAERGWPTLSDPVWRRSGYAILILAVLGSVMILGAYKGILPSDPALYSGGWHWEALVASAVEGALAVAAPFWLLGYFRRHLNSMFPMGKQLVRSYYGAYVVQAPVVIALVLALRGLSIPTELKFLVAAPLGIVASFTLAYYFVQLPGVKRVL
ncbi:MAG TPA: acyltransferase [Chloroflexota bacterium]